MKTYINPEMKIAMFDSENVATTESAVVPVNEVNGVVVNEKSIQQVDGLSLFE